MKSKTDNISELNSLPWAKIMELSKSERLGKKYKYIPEETLLFAMRESNREILIESALKSLETTDPEHANLEQAIGLSDEMREFALRELAERKQS